MLHSQPDQNPLAPRIPGLSSCAVGHNSACDVMAFAAPSVPNTHSPSRICCENVQKHSTKSPSLAQQKFFYLITESTGETYIITHTSMCVPHQKYVLYVSKSLAVPENRANTVQFPSSAAEFPNFFLRSLGCPPNPCISPESLRKGLFRHVWDMGG